MFLFTFETREEQDKFTFVYENYKKYVFYTIQKFTDDTSVIEDLFQEIFIIIANNLSKIDITQEKRSRNFIITIARNYLKNYLRKQQARKESSLEEKEDFITPASQTDILENIVVKEAVEKLKKEIDLLNDKYKIVLELKYINGFTDEEIANFLGISKKTVQMRAYRAKKLLRSKLGEDSNA